MSEHQGSSFVDSCVKVPVDPYSRQPTPLYERPRLADGLSKRASSAKGRRINFAGRNDPVHEDSNQSAGSLENLVDFLGSIPDYDEIHHLSNEQFKRKLDYLKRKQRLLLNNLQSCFDREEDTNKSEKTDDVAHSRPLSATRVDANKTNAKQLWSPETDLELRGKKCYLEDSRNGSPLLFSGGTFAGLAEDQDLLTYRCRDKATKTMRNREIHSAGKSWSTWSDSNKSESVEGHSENSAETRSLPPNSPKRWHPTVPKPFRFALRDDVEKYMSMAEIEDRSLREVERRKNSCSKKRRVRPIPLTSRIPLYDKLMAAKEERSRMVREESAWSLMSQVRPFRLECERRAGKALSRSSPELSTKNLRSTSRFKAKPVPRNLFGTEIYDRMLEDEYYKQLRNKVRAAELLKSASLPPSMARRERVRSLLLQTRPFANVEKHPEVVRDPEVCSATPVISERSRSTVTELSTRGNNLAAILRCQASRDKLEREIREKMEAEQRERMMKVRSALISRKPAWRVLRQTARQEHERDLDFRTCLRRDEAREQAERHRLEMEMMLSRVTQIPTLFERHSQSYRNARQLQSRQASKCPYKESNQKKRKSKRPNSSSLESDASPTMSASRPDSGSMSSTATTTRGSATRSTESSSSRKSDDSTLKSDLSAKKKNDRGTLRVSINETAQFIEDRASRNDEKADSPSDHR